MSLRRKQARSASIRRVLFAVHSSSSLAGSSPSSLFLGVLGVGVIWKGLFKKGPEGPLALPNSCPAVPLVAHPQPPQLQPLTKALTSQQKCVQQRQQLLYSCNERSLFLGSQGDVRVSFQSVWGYRLSLIQVYFDTFCLLLLLKKKTKIKPQVPLNVMQCVMNVNQKIKKLHLKAERLTLISYHPASLSLHALCHSSCLTLEIHPPPHPLFPQAGAADERETGRAWKAVSWQSSWPPGFSPLLRFLIRTLPPIHL